MVYRWRDGRSMGVPAQVAGEVLEQLRQRDGFIVPAVVVAEARPAEAPLHEVFEWRQKVAAQLYRESQAREMIRSVRLVEGSEDRAEGDDEDEEAPEEHLQIAFVSVGTPVKGGSAYVSTAEALSDVTMRERVLRDAISGLRAWQSRYGHLEELAEVVAVIEDVQAIEV